ncbi:hypothetical protein QQG74_10025 [Micromonospora sp. FIMYZ51]|uniref:hypothetical protein n=1 Tax=Micromonospora sp. FIMYZ51 TaxID=3051832 RepID=UPI0031200D56
MTDTEQQMVQALTAAAPALTTAQVDTLRLVFAPKAVAAEQPKRRTRRAPQRRAA